MTGLLETPQTAQERVDGIIRKPRVRDRAVHPLEW
jgi:hypothetical protein